VETPKVIWPCALPDAKPTVIKALKQMPIIQYCSTMHVKKKQFQPQSQPQH